MQAFDVNGRCVSNWVFLLFAHFSCTVKILMVNRLSVSFTSVARKRARSIYTARARTADWHSRSLFFLLLLLRFCFIGRLFELEIYDRISQHTHIHTVFLSLSLSRSFSVEQMSISLAWTRKKWTERNRFKAFSLECQDFRKNSSRWQYTNTVYGFKRVECMGWFY